MKTVVFWRISYSPHMDSLFKSLRCQTAEVKVVVVYFEPLRQARKNQGWNDIGTLETDDHFQPDDTQTLQLAERFADPSSVHIFSGILYHTKMRRVFQYLKKKPCRRVLLTEGRDFSNLKGKLRRCHSWWIEGRQQHRIDRILAIGELSKKNYETLGFNSEKIRPFAYIVEPSLNKQTGAEIKAVELGTAQVELAVIGRLIPLKRIDLVISALSCLKHLSWHLRIVGDGVERARLERLADEHGLGPDRIHFTGVLPNDQVKEILSQTDYMVFASNRDGWGAVVNESLLEGTPVICSDYPGAATLIHQELNGWLFQTDMLDSLTGSLEQCLQRGKTTMSTRARIRFWSDAIKPEAMARYFLEQLEPTPAWFSAPWLDKARLQANN